ncbi:MAG TPA: type II CAAX endopeptidase family protein [Chloroflexota bacterium]|nr:type II CAAX endopeptidase family protein [Chloroflexota bacterium]
MQSHFPRYSSILHPISPPKPRLPRDAAAPPAWWGVPMVYLVALGLAEAVAAVSGVRLGMISQAFVLFLLVVHGLATQDHATRALLHSLVAVPLSSLLALALPMSSLPAMPAALISTVVILGAVLLAARPLRFSAANLRLRLDASDLPLAGLAVPLGLVLGAAEYTVLRPQTAAMSVLPVLVIALIAALQQEIAFRGFMLTAAERLFGAGPAIVYTAILFAVPHLSLVPNLAVPAAFLVGAVFAAMTVWARSVTPAIVASASLTVSLTLLTPALLAH